MTSFCTQTAQTEFPCFISRRKILGSLFLTAKMASLSIDHRWSKFKGKNCKELMSSDVGWHIRDKLRPVPKHGSIIALRPRKPEGSLGRTAQDGHLDSHTAPELWLFKLLYQWLYRTLQTPQKCSKISPSNFLLRIGRWLPNTKKMKKK